MQFEQERPHPSRLSDDEIRAEIQENTEEAARIQARAEQEIPIWDKSMWFLGTCAGIAGLLMAPAVGAAAVALTVVSFGITAIDIGKKVGDVQRNTAALSKVDYLRRRNQALYDEWKRRP